MSDTIVHRINISYDESFPEVGDFVKYLKREGAIDEMKSYHDQARKNPDHKIYMNDKKGNEFTLTCEHEHICRLGLRGM